MRITLCCRPFLGAGVATALKSLGAQLLVSIVLGAIAIAFGAGVANAERGPVAPAPAPRHTSAADSARWPRVGPWAGDGFGPYIVGPAATNSSEEPPASSEDATWPPTGPSWPPGGSSGDSSGSATPIVMPHDQPGATPPASAQEG
jgi:hypothetical protein